MIAKGSMRIVEIQDYLDWVIKTPYMQEGYAANQREIDIFKSNSTNLSLCPIDLRRSSSKELYMEKAALHNCAKMNSNSRTKAMLKQVYNPETLHANLYEASDLADTLSRFISAHIIELPAAIDFINHLEQLYANVPTIFDDLHWENIGILNNRPVIIDYAGWE